MNKSFPAGNLFDFYFQIDPRDTSVVLFPGQGSQFVGMGMQLLEYPNVMDMYDLASEILRKFRQDKVYLYVSVKLYCKQN